MPLLRFVRIEAASLLAALILIVSVIAVAQPPSPSTESSFAAARKSASARTPRHRLRSSAPRPQLVAYFGQWGVYDGFFLNDLVKRHAVADLDQINYAQGFVTNGRCSVADPNADLNLTLAAGDSVTGVADLPTQPFRGNLHQLAELKRLHPRLRVLISLEGRAADFAADAQPAVRPAFVASCVDIFLRGHLAPGIEAPGLFDGIDLDWEYPHDADAANFFALLADLRAAMKAVRPGLRLTIAAGPSPRMYAGVDLPALNTLVDQVGLMHYDFNGPWSPRTGFLAPLYAEPGRGYSVEQSLLDWQAAGIPANKLLLGLPFYGYGWQNVPRTGNGLLQPGKGIRGDRPYRFFRDLMLPPSASPPETDNQPAPPPPVEPATVPSHVPAAAPSTPAPILFRDPHSRAPWLFDGSTFWTYEDPTSIRTKARYARDHQLGGVMVWELSEDAEDSALLHAAHSGLLTPR